MYSYKVTHFYFPTESTLKKKPDGGEPPAKISRRETLDSAKENKRAAKEEASIAEQNRKERRKSEGLDVAAASQQDIKENNSKKELSISSSPKFNAKDAPAPEDLIKAIQSLENAASFDGKVREQIAQLPPEVSDAALVNKVSGMNLAFKLFFLTHWQ